MREVAEWKWTPTAPASEEYYRSAVLGGYMLLIGSVSTFGFSVWAFLLAIAGATANHGEPGRRAYFFIAIGLFLAVMGLYALIQARQMQLPALSAIGTSNTGLALRWVSGPPTILRWDELGFRVKVWDTRSYQPANGARVASHLKVAGRSGGLTTEACDVLLDRARFYGLRINERPRRGFWGEIGRYTLGPRQGA